MYFYAGRVDTGQQWHLRWLDERERGAEKRRRSYVVYVMGTYTDIDSSTGAGTTDVERGISWRVTFHSIRLVAEGVLYLLRGLNSRKP